MTAPDTPSDPAGLDARVERCRHVVDTLLDVGMKLVRTLDPERGPAPVRDPFQAYCRVSRALRLTLLLEARLAAVADEGAPAVAAERGLAGTSEDMSESDPLDRRETGEAAQGAGRELDREAPDEIDRFLARPMTELVAAICRDFGLSRAQADDARAAFADLTANDDADDPDRSDPGPAALAGAGERDLQRRGLQRAGSPLGRRPP